MPYVVVLAEIENPAKWEEGFRSHGELFKTQHVSTCHYSMGEGNEVVVCFETGDLDKFMQIMQSQATAEAMAFDGIKRETVKIFALDKQFTP